MRFFLQSDHGHLITGWVIPDNPLAISGVYVSVEGRRVAEVSATIVDTYILQHGWHSTGQCRFEITEEIVPGLASIPELEIHDADTNLLIYRRLPEQTRCKDKVILINSSIHPETAIQAALYPYFRQSYFGIGKFSEQILTNLFDTESLVSCLISGALPFPRYEHHFEHAKMVTMMLVHDPFTEMASRMIWLRARGPLAGDPLQRWRLGDLVAAAAFAHEYDYDDIKSLKRFFRMLPEAAYLLLYNPLTRQLGTKAIEDRLQPGNSILAVEGLSRIGVVGHREYFDAFVTTVFDRLGIEAPLPIPAPIPPETLALADRLRSLRVTQDFLDFDNVIGDGVKRSVARSWAA